MYRLGDKIRLTIFGRSHSPYVGGILEGIPKGMTIDPDMIAEDMILRKPSAGIGTPRSEDDIVVFADGIRNNKTDGNPILFTIDNKNTDGSKYLGFSKTPRPGHADLPALVKFKDHDIRGGGQFSGRLTAPIVAAGSIAKQFISDYGISVSAFTRSIGSAEDCECRDQTSIENSRKYPTRACDPILNGEMIDEILSASANEDSVGGVVECVTMGLPIGFGGIWFEALDAEISKAVFGIPACKGIEFGKGFELSRMRGSESNDPYYYNNGIRTKTNNMGGILGGMSDGAPMVFRTVFKPTPSIGIEQHTVNLDTAENDTVCVRGRHDPCIVPRAVSVVEAVTALVIADQIKRGL